MALPTSVTVARGTANANSEDVRIREVAPIIKELEPDEAQLSTLLMSIDGRAKRVANPKVEWIEDEHLPKETTLGADATSGAATLNLVDWQFVRKNDVLKINNQEQVLVTATPTTSTVSVSRNFGTSGAKAASSGAYVLILGDANEENSAKRDLLSVRKSVKSNFLQIMRTNIGLTQTAINSDFYGGSDWNYQKRKAAVEHKRKADRQFIHGEKYEDSSGSQYRHITGGVLNFIATFVKDAGGDLTEPELEDFLRSGFRFGSADKVALCSPKAITVINSFGRDKVRTTPETKKYGITIGEYFSAGRNVRLVEHKQLTHDNLDDFNGLAGYMIVLDLQDVELCYMGGAMVEYQDDIQTPGTHGKEADYVSQWGIRLFQERKHMLVKGIQA